MNSILIVDDEASFRENLAEYFQAKKYNVLQADCGAAALKVFESETVAVVIADVRMPKMDGIALMAKLKELAPESEVLIMTGHASVESAVEAMRLGAFHYLTKPVRLSELELLVRRAIEQAALKRQNLMYREEHRRKHMRSASSIVAKAPAMLALLDEARRVAATDMNVLIEGETGTGKELLAEFIHAHSMRRDAAFSVLNCASFSENLLDAELFGHEKGAFTGAVESRAGMLELADGGTLLLDEIGDIQAPAQVRFLRFLDRGLIRRVGSTREFALNVRILAATHRNMEREVKEGRFREDLYHRLVVVRLRIPPLRDRREDILFLAGHFLDRVTAPGELKRSFSDGACEALQNYVWPGNVREMLHVIERANFAARLENLEQIQPKHLNLIDRGDKRRELMSLREIEQEHIEFIVSRFAGNRSKAAKVLGISERHLYRMIAKSTDPQADDITDGQASEPERGTQD